MDVDGLVVRVRRRWVLALALLGVLGLFAFGSMLLVVDAQDGAAAEVNIAGRQRMLSQRIALLGKRLADTPDATVSSPRREDLESAVELFATSHDALVDGDPDRGLPGGPSDEILQLRAGPAGLDTKVETHVRRARGLLASSDPRLRARMADGLGAAAARSDEHTLLGQLDRAVSIYEAEAEADVLRAETVALGVLVVTLAALAAVARRVFVPMERGLRRAVEHDVALRRRHEAALRHQVDHDGLTGLWSRERLRLELDAVHDDPGAGVAVLFCDLDDFKGVNDRLGHDAGDEVLRAIGGRITATLRDGCGAARIGGDEFAVLLVDVTAAQADVVAARVVEAVSSPIAVAGGAHGVAVSVGLVHSTRPDPDVDLLSQADAAMFTAKRSGGAVARFTPEIGERESERARLRADVAGLADDPAGLWLAFQPLVDNIGGGVVGFEALLRWDHPRLGSVGPDVLVAQAEASGRMVEIGAWVVDAALATQRRLAALHAPTPRVWVNVSATQLRDPGLADVVLSALERHGATGEDLVVELTESVAAEDLDVVRHELTVLRDAGVLVALDDFGTGYSSLSHLRDIPLDLLKLDRALVADDAAEARSVLRAVAALCDELGLRMVAEGIEDEAAHERVAALGIQLGQGWHIARPMPADDALDFLAASHGRADGTSKAA